MSNTLLNKAAVHPGDIIGWSGRGLVSRAIKAGAWLHWYRNWFISHVSIVSTGGILPSLTVMHHEATTLGGDKAGVRARPLGPSLLGYPGKAWLYRIRPIDGEDCVKMFEWLRSVEGVPYDKSGALRSWLDLFDWLPGVRSQEQYKGVFCSHLCVGALKRAGVFNEHYNAAEVEPAELVDLPMFRKPVRLI